MKRGRIFIYLALIIIVVLAGGFFYLKKLGGGTAGQAAAQTQTAAAEKFVQVISAAQPISPGTQITEAMLASYQMPEANLVQGLFTDPRDVINMYAKVSIPQGAPITATELAATAGNINLPGSAWASYIPQGLTAVSIPVSRLSSAAFAIRDGDYVNIVTSMLLMDVDPNSQTAYPFHVAGITVEGGYLKSLAGDLNQGTYTPEDAINSMDYLYPSEDQRPRMVTQMIMQNIQVLHVGSFPLPGEANADQLNPQASNASVNEAATPQPTQAPSSIASAVVKPDIITLMVTPQDAVTLIYLISSKAQITLTLRNPSDQDTTNVPDAAMLEYLLTQYNIPVPAKLPYSSNPRIDAIQEPTLPNDVVQP